MFQQILNTVTGEFEWVLIEEAGEEEEGGLLQTSYLDMLNDCERNAAFESAIAATLQGREGPCLVLDIGAGTGLLSMMAARTLQNSIACGNKSVIACEAFLPMFKLARKVLYVNGFLSSVELLYKRSDEMKLGIDIPSRADFLVTEILDSTLLGEGLIPTLQHAHDCLLKPDAGVIPNKATIYSQLVECKFLWRLHDLAGIEKDICDGLVLAPLSLDDSNFSNSLQYPMHVDPLRDYIKMLSDPFQSFNFDFSRRLSDFEECNIVVKVTNSGMVHAILSWWVLEIDNKGTIVYSTAPKWAGKTRQHWHDHWKQCVWFVPGCGVLAREGERLMVKARHWNISFDYDIKQGENSDTMPKAISMGKVVYPIMPERIGLMGSQTWRSMMIAAVRKLRTDYSPSCCLVVDDSIPLSIIAASELKPASLISLLPGLHSSSQAFERALEMNRLDASQIEVIGKKACELTLDDLAGRKVDVLLAEPYYQAYENMLPWRNLRFWNERTVLSPFLSDNVVMMPYKGVLFGLAASMEELWQSRQPLRKIHGFHHSSVNRSLGACGCCSQSDDRGMIARPVWQCGDYEELSKPYPIMKFEFSRAIETVHGSSKIEISKSGVCHGVILWIDWVMNVAETEVIYTGPQGREPTYWKQGVYLLPSPMRVTHYKPENVEEQWTGGHPCILHLSAAFKPDHSLLDVEVKIK